MFLSAGKQLYCGHDGKNTTVEECKYTIQMKEAGLNLRCTMRHKLYCTWNNPLFNYDGECLKEGYLGNTEVKEIFNSLTYHPIRNMSKEEAFAELLKPLLENFGPEELTEYLISGNFLSLLKAFYPRLGKTEYSLAFGI